ncbi:DUF1080 domain-containing protein [Alteromonadaceae bacterium BrNp21-10]|nr:DUF1080 domain-containing protein [Alteromonadaceae bacterium BrNp21-10]
MRVKLALCGLLLGAIACKGQAQEWQNLLDEELSQWHSYLAVPGKHSDIPGLPKNSAGEYSQAIGHDKDPTQVFSTLTENSEVVLHISGEIYGSVYTRQQFENYHLRLQVKWGEKKWPPRLELARDAGIMYHSIGEHGVDYWKAWTLSQELQIEERNFGDYWSQVTSSMDIACAKPDGAEDYIYQQGQPLSTFGEGGVTNRCRRDVDRENPHGQWNSVELISVGHKSLHIVNGQVVMALQNSRYLDDGVSRPLTKGHILLQSEAAEVFYKQIQIRPVTAIPSQYLSLFE